MVESYRYETLLLEKLISIGAIEELVLVIKTSQRQEGSSLHEMTLRALCLLLQSKPEQTLQRLKNNQLGAKDILLQAMSHISSQSDREPYRVGCLLHRDTLKAMPIKRNLSKSHYLSVKFNPQSSYMLRKLALVLP